MGFRFDETYVFDAFLGVVVLLEMFIGDGLGESSRSSDCSEVAYLDFSLDM